MTGRDRELKWQPYVWREPRPAKPGEVEALEQAWGVSLPETYKKLVASFQGMTPVPNIFNIGSKSENVFSELLTVTLDEERAGYFALRVYEVLKPHIPSGIFPFGSTPGGERLCFDYRADPSRPQIVLASVECDLYPVAASFEGFLAGLHD